METYKPWDFCSDIQCKSLSYPGPAEDRITFFCEDCKAFKMHQYLKDMEQINEEGSPILSELERLRGENEQLQAECQKWMQARPVTLEVKHSETITRLLDLLRPYIEHKEAIIVNDDPELVELIAVFREIMPK